MCIILILLSQEIVQATEGDLASGSEHANLRNLGIEDNG